LGTIFLKQSTAINVLIGPFIDDTDGKTAKTGLTLAQADIRLSKNAGNMAQKGDATACTHDELGYYTCPLSTTDTGTLGSLKLMVHQAGSLPVFHDYQIVTANWYDAMCSTDSLDVNLNADQSAAAVGLSAAAVDAVLDEVVEGSTWTMRKLLKLLSAVVLGKSSGGGTNTLVFRDLDDSANRLTATVDANGNRTAVVTVTT
jgi:hypothetical protein